MKRYVSKFAAVMIITFAALAFSSCHSDDDEYVVRSSLFCDFRSTTDSYGYFESARTYTLNDVPEIRNSGGRVVDMRYRGAEFTIEGLPPGIFYEDDYIDDFYLEIQGFKPFLVFEERRVEVDGEVVRFGVYSDNDPEFFDFLEDTMYDLYDRGKVSMIVSGYIDNYEGAGIKNVNVRVTIENYFDFIVRE